MLSNSILSLAFLPGAFGLQDDFLSLEWGYHVRREGLADGGCVRNIALPQLQVLSPPRESLSFGLVSRSAQAGDRLLHPPASSYPLDTLATPRSSSYLSNDLFQGQQSRAPASLAYPAPSSPTWSPEGLNNFATHPAPSQCRALNSGISESERETLDSIARCLLDEETCTTTSPHGFDQFNPNLALGFDLTPHLLTPLSRTETLQQLQREPYGESGVTSPMLGSSTGFPRIAITDKELNGVVSGSLLDNPPREGFQGFAQDSSMGPNKKYKIAYAPRLDQMVQNKPNVIPTVTSTLKSTNAKQHSLEKSDRTTSSSRGTESSSYALMTDLASRLQKGDEERWAMVKKTVTKWLPVYKKHFEFEPQNRNVKAKLLILFEQLWKINTLLLHSFDFEILKKKKCLHRGHDLMMSWVAHQIDAAFPFSGPELPGEIQQTENVWMHISSFLRAETQSEGLFIKKRRRNAVEIDKENVSACELAVRILDAYYKSSNSKRYLEVFCGKDLPTRLLYYTTAKKSDNLQKWKTPALNMYGTVLLPWSATVEKEIQNEELDPSLQELFQSIFRERLVELKRAKWLEKTSNSRQNRLNVLPGT